MARLVLTVVGDDRAGLVRALADAVAAREGNWLRSELAELAGTFAGVVLIDVPDRTRAALEADLQGLHGLLTVTPYPTDADPGRAGGAGAGERVTVTVLGNDHPGIVRDVTAALARDGVTVDAFTSRTMPAPMSGGELFEATVTARASSAGALAAAVADLERLAGEIQVEVTVA